MSAPPSPRCPAEILSLAGTLADASGDVIRRYFRKPLAVDDKSDDSPVTAADREAEEAIRALIARHRPEDGVIGEEYGSDRADAEFVWVIDPIDGTKAFITGRPIFGTLIAAVHGGVPVLGVIDQPVAGERWIGATGCGATLDGAAIRVRPCASLSEAVLCTTSPHLFAGSEMARYRRVEAAAKHAVFGGDCYNYAMVATGFVDIVVEAGLKSYDYCALAPIIEEAGGLITDWHGAKIRLGSDGTVVAAGDPRLHAEALALLAG